jgi:hypothetical protein
VYLHTEISGKVYINNGRKALLSLILHGTKEKQYLFNQISLEKMPTNLINILVFQIDGW